MKPGNMEISSGNSSIAAPMPLLFLGHGSPMNAIEENQFTIGWRTISETIREPEAILCISAHWETEGTFVTAMEKPRTIHDFGGFPDKLYEVQYPAPGSPEIAAKIKATIRKAETGLDMTWGLDHGCWSVVKHLYPSAEVPLVQLSLDYYKSPEYHYELAKELSTFRKKRVLIIGSGNMVHNLGLIAWNKMDESEYGFDWAIEANSRMKDLILSGNHRALIDYKLKGKEFSLAIPTPEHFLPLLYILALKEENERITFFNDKLVMGSLAMTSMKIN
jgi:4,5-DOPA dioxygenase extradiol